MRYLKLKVSNEFKADGLSELLKHYPDCTGHLFNIEDDDEDKGLLTVYLYYTEPNCKCYLFIKIRGDDVNNTESIIKKVVDLNSHAYLDDLSLGYDADDFVNNMHSLRLEFLLP